MSRFDYETETLNAVSDFLGNALPGSGVKRRAANGEDRQLLLLTMPQLVAGFGFTSQNLESTYSKLYGAFKKEYTENRNEWDELDLAFVLCVPEGISSMLYPWTGMSPLPLPVCRFFHCSPSAR